MRKLPRKYVIGGAALVLLGAGVADAATAKLRTMTVDAPDGSTIEVQYAGDVAPRVEFVPADEVAVPALDPFAEMQRVSALMDAQMQAMMRQAALVQQQAAHIQQQAVATGAAQAGPGMTLVGAVPQGMHVTYYSSTTDATGCTRAVSYSSDGSGAAPKLTQAASEGCEAAKPSGAAIPVKAEKPADPAPGQKV